MDGGNEIERETSKKRVLVVGGTGYLGQHLLEGLLRIQGTKSYDVAYTYHTYPIPEELELAVPQVPALPIDLSNGYGFDEVEEVFGVPDVVINCAALSVPRACEKDPVAAKLINMASNLVQWLSGFELNHDILLIHLSTDQVYAGVKSFYKEDDETDPVNVYGETKKLAEEYISTNCPYFAILRSSIIFGPQPISPVPKSLPIQWIDSILSKGEQVEFFYDEFRCPVYVKDVVSIILKLTDVWISGDKQMQLVLNVGGPDRLSRAQMAEVVADIRGYNSSLIKPVSASTVDRGVNSPADISMDISKLIETLEISPIPFKEGVKLTLAAEAH